MQEYKCKIKNITNLNSDTVYLTIECPDIANMAKPGQFVNISADKFLKRPFGIASVDKDNGTFCIGVKIVGKGTKIISQFTVGKEIDVLGPLGNGFDADMYQDIILVAGGTGVFPINFAKEYYTKLGKNVKVIQGFRSKDQIIMSDDNCIVSTDDGTYGIHGNCCDALKTLDWTQFNNPVILTVGPLPMMKFTGLLAKELNVPCFVSMEQRMACGIGICLVCICKIKAEEEGKPFDHKRCCKDGPVFPYEEVIW